MSSFDRKPQSVDTVFLTIIVTLVTVGFLIFSSASLGLLARGGASFSSVAFSQFAFGILGGGAALLILSNVHYRHYRKQALWIFIIGLIGTLAVFIPGVGMTHAGATRWIDLGFTTVQPSEFLKVAYIIYLATWLSGMHRHVGDWRFGLVPFGIISSATGVVMLLQPDTDTFLVMAAGGMAMFVVAGARYRDLLILALCGIALITTIAFLRPYVMDRLTTFMDPAADPLGSGWQINQSLIAVGSGGIAGRGFGQSIQKFEYLPEPIGDSIFAVYSEEFGFIGVIALLSLFVAFALRGYKIAQNASDMFGVLLVTGIITVIMCQAFLNIGAMLGVAPLSGLPLPFISHGGTALLSTLAALGIVLNVSKYRLKR
jgi:cell division protein FtsW